MTPIPPDKSLLRCTLKKSADVLCKWVLWASYAIVGIAVTALSLLGAFGIWSVVAEPLVAGAMYITGSIGTAFSLLAAIPWYCYVGAMALLAIPVYSFLWCVARELTDEDWKSIDNEDTNQIAVGCMILCLLLPAIVEVLIYSNTNRSNRALAFPFAYLHYRRRVRG